MCRKNWKNNQKIYFFILFVLLVLYFGLILACFQALDMHQENLSGLAAHKKKDLLVLFTGMTCLILWLGYLAISGSGDKKFLEFSAASSPLWKWSYYLGLTGLLVSMSVDWKAGQAGWINDLHVWGSIASLALINAYWIHWLFPAVISTRLQREAGWVMLAGCLAAAIFFSIDKHISGYCELSWNVIGVGGLLLVQIRVQIKDLLLKGK